MRERRCCQDGLSATVARQQRAESEMQVAQPGLGRGSVVLVIPASTGVIVLLVRGQMVVKVPDRVRERALLRDEQQNNASELQ
jgi:hypothetical protein